MSSNGKRKKKGKKEIKEKQIMIIGQLSRKKMKNYVDEDAK